MVEIDFGRAFLLLSVIEKAIGHPQLRPIVTIASDELHAMIAPTKTEEAKTIEEAPAEEEEVKSDETKDKPTVGRRL